MKNNQLILYKDNIFTKITNFLKNLLFRKKKYIVDNSDKNISYDIQKKKAFTENIAIKENEEEKRLKVLQLKYDRGEIDEEDISEEDIEKLIKMYEKETEELNNDTERRKIHIVQMLKELKSVT